MWYYILLWCIQICSYIIHLLHKQLKCNKVYSIIFYHYDNILINWIPVVPGQAGGGSFQKEKNYKHRKNLPIECAHGDRPARCPNHFFAVNEPSALPWWWCFVLWSEVFWCLDVCSRVRSCDGHVTWCDVMACVVSCHVKQCDVVVMSCSTPVLVCTTKYYSSTTHTTPYYKYYSVLLQYYAVLQSTTPVLTCTTKYCSSTNLYYKVLLCTTKYYSSTTLYYKVLLKYYKVLLQYYLVLLCTTKCYSNTLLCTTPVLPCTTKYYSSTTLYYSSTTLYYKVLLQYYPVLQSTSWLIRIAYETSFTMPGATKGSLQLQQILRQPRNMHRMLDPHHICNVIYNAGSNKQHPATWPNTAPATQNECHDWSASHMKRHLQ